MRLPFQRNTRSGQPKHVGRRQALPPPGSSRNVRPFGRAPRGRLCLSRLIPRCRWSSAPRPASYTACNTRPSSPAVRRRCPLQALPVFDDNQPVGVAEGGEAMGDDDGRAVLGQTVERRLDLPLVCVSIAAVASSRMRMLGSLSTARAIDTRCRSPPDRSLWPKPTIVS